MSKLKMLYKDIVDQIKELPSLPGVYIFKDEDDHILYIGKAKNLKRRGRSYIQQLGGDVKVDSIFAQAKKVDYISTHDELEALLLEAKMVQSNQPKFNVLLKHGQPFLYLFIPTAKKALPTLDIVRNKKKRGTYFGPFLEKGSARKVHNFLTKTFKLRLCKKKIAGGCLYYHMGQCAGFCRDDFDREAYLERLDLAKNALKKGHAKFLKYLQRHIDEANSQLKFEWARELHTYYQAFEKVFYSIDHKPTDIDMVGLKDIWIYKDNSMFVFSEREGALKKKHVFYFPFQRASAKDCQAEYFLGYYRIFPPPPTILINFDLQDDATLFSLFLKKWHNKRYDSVIIFPQEGHFASLVRLATICAEQELKKKRELSQALKGFLKLPFEPHTVDCFDISHKQGYDMVGSCVRFTNGIADKKKFRHFHIKTVKGQDDYASLREIVQRRYKDISELPDLIMIDGGRGQLNAIVPLFPEAECIALAKREETVFSPRFPKGKVLDQKSFVGQMLIALRDYTHHFALSFHKSVEGKKYK